MEELESGAKVDALVFCKLDRFFRSVKLYYQTVDVLDRYHVAWQAIQEDYETVTAGGRMKVNIMLAVAENEADRTSERIKTVFEHKVNLGQAITSALPLGLTIDGKRVVHDENAHIALAAFEYYAKHGNKRAVRNMLQDDYGLRLDISSVTKMLRNRLYTGEYRGNMQYCEPIVSQDLFDRVQHDLDSRATRRTPSGRVYLFTGLVVCKECGRRMSIIHHSEGNDYYRCHRGHGMYHDCPNSTYLKETRLERIALSHLKAVTTGGEAQFQPADKKQPSVDKTAIQRKLDRLKELYIDGDITKEKYRQQRDELTAKLTVQEPKPGRLKMIVGDNFQEDYATWDRQKRKEFWRSVIDRVDVDASGSANIFFVP